MYFSIITPSYNQLDYLKRCVASVADQATTGIPHSVSGVGTGRQANGCKLTANSSIRVHHHIQDGRSTDGTREFLAEQISNRPQPMANSYTFSYESASDDGMYDAINKGVAFAMQQPVDECSLIVDGDNENTKDRELADSSNIQQSVLNKCNDTVVAWLNCDEQYLPGTLENVAAFFNRHPQVDILFGGMLIVNKQGELLSCRKAMPMRRLFLEASYLYNYSCAMFFRRPAWERLGGLNAQYRNAGDEDLMRRAMQQGMQTAGLNNYLSVFTYGDSNLSSDAASAVQEHEQLKSSDGSIVKALRVPINLLRLAEKGMRGGFRQYGKVQYELYTDRLDVRTHFEAENSGCRWPGESKPYLMNHRLK